MSLKQEAGWGHIFMSTNTAFPQNNGAIHNIVHVIKQVISSTVEAELGALYINGKFAIQMQNAERGLLQPLTPVQTDNSTAYGIVANTIIPEATNAMDMHFHWL